MQAELRIIWEFHMSLIRRYEYMDDMQVFARALSLIAERIWFMRCSISGSIRVGAGNYSIIFVILMMKELQKW